MLQQYDLSGISMCAEHQAEAVQSLQISARLQVSVDLKRDPRGQLRNNVT